MIPCRRLTFPALSAVKAAFAAAGHGRPVKQGDGGMRAWLKGCLALSVLWTQGTPGMAQDAGHAARGQGLVEADCLSCHGDPSRSPRAPDFREVAAMPSTTALSLGVFLRTSHPNMPNIILSPADLDDVIAYILSLKTR
jgi:cytochrome c